MINVKVSDLKVPGPVDPVKMDNSQVLNLRESCTKEEAIAMMLGWMQGYLLPKYIQITENGIPEEQLPFLHSLDGSLQEHLADLRAAAYQDFLVADEANAPIEVLEEKNHAVIRCDKLLKKAQEYLLDITEEIAEGESSALKIDREATAKSGVEHYTLRSVEKWAKETHKISILDPTGSPAAIANTADRQPEDETDLQGRPGKTKADNLYTTFAFLVEYLSTTAPKYRSGDSLNVSAIAKFLEGLSKTSDKAKPMAGQGHEAIEIRITEALRVKRDKLK